MGQIAIPVSGGGTIECVMFAISGSYVISANIRRELAYTNGVTIVVTAVAANNAQTSYSLIGDDFGGIVYNNGLTSNITVKKAGTYEINNHGTITTQKFNANDTFTLPNATYSIRKIK